MTIRSKKELEETIIALEKKKAIQYGIMVHQYRETAESLKPGNLIKSAFSSVTHSAGAKSGLLKAAAGIGLGFLTRKLLWGRSSSVIKRFLGNAVKIGVTKTAFSNMDKVKAYSTAIYHQLFRSKAKQDN